MSVGLDSQDMLPTYSSKISVEELGTSSTAMLIFVCNSHKHAIATKIFVRVPHLFS